MNSTSMIVDAIAGAVGGLLGGLVVYLVAFLRKKNVKEFYRTSTGFALMIGPAIGFSSLMSSSGVGGHVKDWLWPRSAFEREFEALGRALLEEEPALRVRLEREGRGGARAAVQGLTTRGLRRLPAADLRRLGALRLALAEGSPRVCETFWAGGLDDAALAGALSALPEGEQKDFARIAVAAARLEIRNEGVARPPVDAEGLDALLASIARVHGAARGAELRHTFSQGLEAAPADGCRVVKALLAALPELTDEQVALAVLLP